MCIIYIFFYRALKAQGFDRKDLPYIGWAQPYCAWFGLATMTFTVVCYGYTTFLPGCELLPLSPSPMVHFRVLRFVGLGGGDYDDRKGIMLTIQS